VVRFELTLDNGQPADHAGGFWELGSSGSLYFRDIYLTFGLPASPAVASVSCECGEPAAPVNLPFDLYQDSSGGEHWNSSNHLNRNRQVPVSFRGYRVGAESAERNGKRATPIVCLTNDSTALAVAMERFWENFPKGMSARAESISLSLFPGAFADVHELQGGERKTHVFAAAFGRDLVTSQPLDWVRAPLVGVVDPEWIRRCQLYGELSRGTEASRQAYSNLVTRAVEGSDSFFDKREIIDEFGWRHFGDLYADHESVLSAQPLVSHYNNQYDAIAGFAVRFLTTADVRWAELMDDLALHVADIDIYHTQRDSSAYNNGLFWHTNHHIDAGTASHRTYSRDGRQGGGPSAEHNYTTGLMLHHFLTGSPRSREAVLQLANWVVDMDAGRLTRFWWLDAAETGRASATTSVDYHGPGRGAGNSINALLDAHRLTGDEQYLRKADELVTRCIHPDDDPTAMDLLDAERRWSYTVFLQVLGKYLEYRAVRGLFDFHYDYARESLLTYATWMLDHEKPYLDRAEQLQFPNETWVAQDIRKAAVFEFAAAHSDEPDRGRFLVKANFFFDYAIETLAATPTSVLTRPMVLLLSYNVQRPSLSPATTPKPRQRQSTTDFGPRAKFAPYKARIIYRAAVVAAGATTVITGLWAILWGALTR
jgi:hypothetical protein